MQLGLEESSTSESLIPFFILYHLVRINGPENIANSFGSCIRGRRCFLRWENFAQTESRLVNRSRRHSREDIEI